MKSRLTDFLGSKIISWGLPFVQLIVAVIYDIYLLKTIDLKRSLYSFIGDIVISILFFMVAISFQRHEKNVTKMLVAGVFGLIVSANIYSASNQLVFYYEDVIKDVTCVICALCYLGIFVNHLILASDHKSRYGLVNANFAFAIVALLAEIGYQVKGIIVDDANVLYSILYIVYDITLVLLILNNEVKINNFKAIRETR